MNIVIIGAGNGGTKLINLFSEINKVNILCVVDKNLDSPGITRSKSLGIPTTTNLLELPQNVDVIIEATGNQNVLALLEENYKDKSKIVDASIAEMLIMTVDLQMESSKILKLKLDEINESLTEASKASQGFIVKTDEMIRAINKITQQIKILGLNANIEAARAGEHGRGFSVVATEIQKMSDTTNSFASEIADLLSALSVENEHISTEVDKLNQIANSKSI